MPTGYSLGDAARTGPFWVIYVGALLMSFGLFVPFVHLAPYARDIGLGEGFGVLLIVLLGLGSTVGRFLFASVTGWIGRRRSFAMMYVGAAVMLVVWSLSTSAPALVIFALLFGAFYGGFVAIAPSLAADYFGARALGSIIGALYSGVGFGALLGSPAAGYAFDFFGSYTGAIMGGAALCLVSFLITLMMPEPREWLARHQQPR
jgi:MFS family permease